jgi:hypothetical protein
VAFFFGLPRSSTRDSSTPMTVLRTMVLSQVPVAPVTTSALALDGVSEKLSQDLHT